jgi:stage II sporulation protein R
MPRRILIFTLIFLFFIPAFAHAREDKIIRLHVIANSDTDEDQGLKLDIRDQVLKDLECLEQVSSSQEAIKYIEENIDDLQASLINRVKEKGFEYPILIELALSDFPTRKYQNYILPAGRYLALKVIIGEGKGANWWCVLFPPICHGNWVQEPQKRMVNEEKVVPVITLVQERAELDFNLKTFAKEYFSLLRKVWGFSQSP